jgi:hypothetical protein
MIMPRASYLKSVIGAQANQLSNGSIQFARLTAIAIMGASMHEAPGLDYDAWVYRLVWRPHHRSSERMDRYPNNNQLIIQAGKVRLPEYAPAFKQGVALVAPKMSAH